MTKQILSDDTVKNNVDNVLISAMRVFLKNIEHANLPVIVCHEGNDAKKEQTVK